MINESSTCELPVVAESPALSYAILTKQGTIERLEVMAQELDQQAGTIDETAQAREARIAKSAIKYALIEAVSSSERYGALISPSATDLEVLKQLQRSGYLNPNDRELNLAKEVWNNIYAPFLPQGANLQERVA